MMRARQLCRLFIVALVLDCTLASAEEPTNNPAAILQELKGLGVMGSVLYVAAHPDDENTQLITYFARGRQLRTAYLSLTRGDGGQNVLGGEFGEQLGYIRTEELLAARRQDGGQQFFTRAMDFGFSKDYRETLQIWNKDQVVADMVRVIRTFRPDVMVTRFSPQPGGTHGHHTASAVLALEAFKLAGDPSAYPDQHLAPWQPRRVYENGRGGGTNGLSLDINGTDPVTGETFGVIAGRSRAMHKSQGFDNFRGGGNVRPETFQWLAGETVTNDLFEGIDSTWRRVAGGAEVADQIAALIAQFNLQDPAASLPALLTLKKSVAALPADPVVVEKSRALDRLIQHCLGLEITTTMPVAEVVPGEKVALHHAFKVRGTMPVKWLEVRHPTLGGVPEHFGPLPLTNGVVVANYETFILPATTPLTQPYWLREEATAGMFQVAETELIGQPENPPALPLEYVFSVGGQTLVLTGEPLQAGTHRRLEVIPPVALKFSEGVVLFAPGEHKLVGVELTAARENVAGKLQLTLPAGWRAEPPTQVFHLGKVGDHQKMLVEVYAPTQASTATLGVTAEVGGKVYDTGRIEIA
ncbi:MAG TPA: PIG-L family deacetylase [Verrucomicrobiae bacterium]